MTYVRTSINRRSFLKATALTGGGMMLSFSWFASCNPSPEEALAMPKEWFDLNSYIKIGENGIVTLMAPNPEFGSNVKTSLPMILADELDVDWNNVIVEQADFYPERFERQFTGGSQSVRQGWKILRTAGAAGRQMLISAAAQTWNVPAQEITTESGTLHHKASGKTISYGEIASKAGKLSVPEEVKLKDVKDFKIIRTSRKNVDGTKIVTGKPLFTIDYKQEGMLIAMIAHPPAFGLTVKSVDDAEARKMPGIKDVFRIKTLSEDYERNGFDTTTFTELVVIVGKTTWEVMNARKALKLQWEQASSSSFVISARGKKQTIKIPSGLESTTVHRQKMADLSKKAGKLLRQDGNPEQAFKSAAKVIERRYTAPYLAHNTMEPVNCFAYVTADKADIYGPIQAPEFTMQALIARLGLPKEKIHIRLARMG
ncbi:MAG TPA: molybdopterin cofactor-binding domain-containing protein, partial [Flavitalea sp.]|nr:molybdopterin cofactor-binding domain-containing protein [Flavitalea sp.]